MLERVLGVELVPELRDDAERVDAWDVGEDLGLVDVVFPEHRGVVGTGGDDGDVDALRDAAGGEVVFFVGRGGGRGVVFGEELDAFGLACFSPRGEEGGGGDGGDGLEGNSGDSCEQGGKAGD